MMSVLLHRLSRDSTEFADINLSTTIMEKRKRVIIFVAFSVSLVVITGILIAVFVSRKTDDASDLTTVQSEHSKSTELKQGPFLNRQTVGRITSSIITEASGLCASRRHKGVIYTHNDSGDKNRIYAISTIGSLLAVITIDGANAHDWEDIACGPCTDQNDDNCVYIADTGGNAGGNAYTIYRIKEPATIENQHVTLDAFLKFSWYMYDCETIMVDPRGEVYVVSKVCAGSNPLLQLVPSDAWGAENRTWVTGGVKVPITSDRLDPVAGDISPDGTEILIKTYGKVYYWYIPDMDYYTGIQTDPRLLPYTPEKQGESVAFAADGEGYYTVSEGKGVELYYYQRVKNSSTFIP